MPKVDVEPLEEASAVARDGLVAIVVWYVFLIWTVIGAIVMIAGLNAENVTGWTSSSAAQEALVGILAYADLIWMVSAAAVVYLRVAAVDGLARARISAAIILAGSMLVEWIGAQTGAPFGPYRYTDAFGPRILGMLPIAIPLAWLVILFGARVLVLEIQPAISRFALSFWVAVIALVTDLNLEFIAWKVRGYWLWYPDDAHPPSWPPWQNFLSWFVLAFVLHALTPWREERAVTERRIPRAALVVPITNVLFLVVHVSRWIWA